LNPKKSKTRALFLVWCEEESLLKEPRSILKMSKN